MLCSVEKHAGSGLSTKELSRETRDVGLCFSLLRFLDAFKQNRAQSRLLCLFYDRESINFPTHYFTLFQPVRVRDLSELYFINRSRNRPYTKGGFNWFYSFN